MMLVFKRTQPTHMGSQYVVECPGTDRAVYIELRNSFAELVRLEQRARRHFRYAAYLLQDLFQAHYQPSVSINPALSPELHRHAAVIGYLLESPAFRCIRRATQSDKHASLLAASDFLDQLLTRLEGQEKRGRHRHSLLLRASAASSAASIDDTDHTYAALPLHYAVLKAAEKIQQHLNALENMRSGWSILPGNLEQYPLNDVWLLLDAIRQLPDYVTLLELVAELKEQIASKGRRPDPAPQPQQINGVATGRTLEHLVPFELAKLTDPALEGLFHDSYENQALTYYRMNGEKPQAEEPFLLCIDTSASMNSQAARNLPRWVWAKALAFALQTATAAKSRPLYVLLFAARGQMITLHAPTGRLAAKDIATLLTYHLGGGTHVETPLAECMKLLHNNSASGGDILLVTDGETPLTTEFQSDFTHFLQRRTAHLYTAFIDGRHDQLAAMSRSCFLIAGTEATAWLNAVADMGRRLL